MNNKMRFKDIENRTWDVLVIGTGMGGAVIGHALAKAGKKVLFCEKGRSYSGRPESLKGDYAETFSARQADHKQGYAEILASSGRCSDALMDVSTGSPVSFIPFIGSGTGGSTALYGMALERFFPEDFTPRSNYTGAMDASLPERWPISYNELLPYYEEAERLFRVKGTADPLRGDESRIGLSSPPPLTAGAEETRTFLIEKGLHPYRLPLACEFVDGCKSCQGYLCDRGCKNDSARICLFPALSQYGAELIDECEVLRIEATSTEVTGVTCFLGGRVVTLHSSMVILAAGALGSPAVLLNSSSSAWPEGLANRSGLVGKNLMRHYIDLYAIRHKFDDDYGSRKELAFNDYYLRGGRKFGTVQSFGSLPPAPILAEEIGRKLNESNVPLAGTVFRAGKPIVQYCLTRFLTGRMILASIMEDLPYSGNCIELSGEADGLGRRRAVLQYRISTYERARIRAFRKEMAKLLKSRAYSLLKQAENNDRIAHACGTCRFGEDPGQSVLDPNNRAHGLSNLYVVDGSFFPSSGGTNPALTIAANALRVSRHLLKKW